MRIMVLFAHPVETSFGAAAHATLVETLRKRHEVDDCDLYAEGFDPVLSRQERLDYHDLGANQARVRPWADRLLAAEGLVLVYPVWNMGFPAMLKGFLDRVFLPGVSFKVEPDGKFVPNLRKIRRLGAVCTYGGNRMLAMMMADPPRKIVKRMLNAQCKMGSSCDYVALYDMNRCDAARRAAFLKEIETRFAQW